MNHFLIGIAGGSGCGKSTLSYRLRDKFPELIEVVHFDDYQKQALLELMGRFPTTRLKYF